jgi:outer membrane protein W
MSSYRSAHTLRCHVALGDSSLRQWLVAKVSQTYATRTIQPKRILRFRSGNIAATMAPVAPVQLHLFGNAAFTGSALLRLGALLTVGRDSITPAEAKGAIQMIKRLITGTLALIVTGLYAGSASAQYRPYSQDVQVYAGEMFGDRLTTSFINGDYPRLDDSVTFGARYTFNLTPQWGLQLSAGYSPSYISHVGGGSTDFGLTTADLDLIWNITPDLMFAGNRLVTYAVVGGGYAWANLDHAIAGSVNGAPMSLDNGNGVTGNAGFGAKYYINERFFIDLDARYRYLNNLVSCYGQGLNTAETTLSLGYQF